MKRPSINLIARCTTCGTHFTIGETGGDSECDVCLEYSKPQDIEDYDADRTKIMGSYSSFHDQFNDE